MVAAAQCATQLAPPSRLAMARPMPLPSTVAAVYPHPLCAGVGQKAATLQAGPRSGPRLPAAGALMEVEVATALTLQMRPGTQVALT